MYKNEKYVQSMENSFHPINLLIYIEILDVLISVAIMVPVVMFCRNSISGHGAKISLICNETMTENEAIFEFINVTNIPKDTYVSMKWKHVDVLLYYVVS